MLDSLSNKEFAQKLREGAVVLNYTVHVSTDIWDLILERLNHMTPYEYQNIAMRTCSIPDDCKRDQLLHAVFGLASEAGEVSGLFQKKLQGHKLDPEHLMKELGDCLWMIAEVCHAQGWSIEEVMALNIEKLRARYPDGFSTEKSLHREPGDV